MNRHAIGAAALSAVAVVVLGACSTTASASRADSGKGYVSGSARAASFAVADRVSAPTISGTEVGGGTLDAASLRGKVVVLNIWASWCAPCRKEAPSLERVWQATRSRGVQFVGLDSRDTQAGAKAFQRRFGITYPSVVDSDGELQLKFRGKLAAAALPTTYIIDRNGKVAVRVTDLLTDVKLRTLLDPVLAEKP
jgi:thiol-disulfide isomerase/thioredoxin